MITCFIRRAPKASRYSGWDAQHLAAHIDNPALDVRIVPQERCLTCAKVARYCFSSPPTPVVWYTASTVPSVAHKQ